MKEAQSKRAIDKLVLMFVQKICMACVANDHIRKLPKHNQAIIHKHWRHFLLHIDFVFRIHSWLSDDAHENNETSLS